MPQWRMDIGFKMVPYRAQWRKRRKHMGLTKKTAHESKSRPTCMAGRL